jgi:hypothetical protein
MPGESVAGVFPTPPFNGRPGVAETTGTVESIGL